MNEVENYIQKLEEEAKEKLSQANNIKKLHLLYTNLKIKTTRWGVVLLYSSDVNSLVNDCGIGYNCGCCEDSPLEIKPYIKTEFGKVYSDPPIFVVGEKNYENGPELSNGWEDELRKNNIAKIIIDKIYQYVAEELEYF